MPVNKNKLKELITKHNDKNSNIVINSIIGTSFSNCFPIRMKKGDVLTIHDGEVVWTEHDEGAEEVLVTRTGVDNIDLISYVELPKAKKDIEKFKERYE